MRRSAFTLIELLVIVAIIGIMATGAVLAVASGQKAIRVRGAARDAFAAIRQARSIALVTQKPAIITYSTAMEDGEPVAKIEITSAKLIDTTADRSDLQTVTGAPVRREEGDQPRSAAKTSAPAETGASDDGPAAGGKEEGLSVEDVLFAPMAAEVVRGMRIKVVSGDEYADSNAEEQRKPKISVFSNVDYLLGRYKDAKAAAAKEEKEKTESAGSAGDAAPVKEEEPVSIVWETNGRVEPHQVWVYPDGARPEDGLCIKVDAFGGAKVVSGDGRD